MDVGSRYRLRSVSMISNIQLCYTRIAVTAPGRIRTDLMGSTGVFIPSFTFSAAGGWTAISITVVMFALLCLITFVFLISGERIVELIGNSGLNIVTRLMGLILAVIGIQMLIEGIANAIRTFGH